MKRGAAIHNTNTDGLRAVCDTPASLPDLCHHAEYRIYVDGQYAESVGSLGSNAQRALDFWKRRRRGKSVEARTTACTLPHCERRRSEEHTSELQSRLHLVCRLLLEK